VRHVRELLDGSSWDHGVGVNAMRWRPPPLPEPEPAALSARTLAGAGLARFRAGVWVHEP